MSQENNLKKLENVLQAFDTDALTREDFVKSFEQVLELVLKIEKKTSDAISQLEQTYQQLLEKVQSDYQNHFTNLKGQVNDVFVGDQIKRIDGELKTNSQKLQRVINGLIEKKLQEVDMRMSKVKDGRTPIKGTDYFDGKHADEILPEQLVAKITKKLSIDDLKDLREELVKFRKEIDAIPRGGSRGKVPMIKRYDLTSQVNGTTKTFTLPIDTMDVIGVFGSQFPINFEPNVDWKFTNGNLVLQGNVSAPASGQTLYAIIEQLFY